MSLYFNILLVLLILLVHLFRRYSGRLVAAVLQRLLHARAAHIDGLGWFALRHGELLLANGLHLEVRDLRVHSLFNWWWTTTAPTVDGTANDGGGQRMALNVRVSVGSIRVGKQLTDEEGSRNSTNGLCDGQPLIEKCGVLDSVSIHLARPVPGQLHLQVELQQPVELIWSPVLHLMVNDVVRAFVSKGSTFSTRSNTASKSNFLRQQPTGTTTPTATQTPTSTTTTFMFTVHSEHAVELSFRLPRHHLLRLILPSFTVQRKAACVANAGAPNLLVEMDGNLIMNVEVGKGGGWQLDANRLWSWSADSLEISFPYGYQFADAWEEVVNSIKWMKLVHGIVPKPFTKDSVLPADVRIRLNRLSLRLDDDPFEIQLQNIYELSHRREMRDGRVVHVPLRTPRDKLQHALRSIAWPMSQAGLSTVICVLPLVFLQYSLFAKHQKANVTLCAVLVSIGMSVDFTAHTAYSFQLSHRREMRDSRVVHVPLRTPRDKLQHALRSIAWPIGRAGLSTVICVLPLVFLQVLMPEFLALSTPADGWR
ncbi:hypothetical protein niasHT_033822 [Heterodera trifolii]|uniref:Uncharacterized protein n=1 Tax=Heterodera trifolii TaxID=157864 RepID=A0ABD2IGD6_9BILA